MSRRGTPADKFKEIPVRRDSAETQKVRALIGIADKNQIVRDGLTEIIRRDGHFHPVIAVATGSEFLKAADELAIDIGIVGWSFTDMTGGDVLRGLKRRQSRIRVIIYSGETGDRVLQEAIHLGAWGFASKRAEPAHLLDIIATVASGRLSLPYIDLRTLSKNPLNGLTERERDLLSALANGWSNQQIAKRFGISRNTVKYHLKNLYDKLDVNSRMMAIALLRSEQMNKR